MPFVILIDVSKKILYVSELCQEVNILSESIQIEYSIIGITSIIKVLYKDERIVNEICKCSGVSNETLNKYNLYSKYNRLLYAGKLPFGANLIPLRITFLLHFVSIVISERQQSPKSSLLDDLGLLIDIKPSELLGKETLQGELSSNVCGSSKSQRYF